MQNKFKKAFTLIELLIVIAIIAILTVAFLPGALKAPAKARDAQRIKNVEDIVAVLESYAAEHNGSYPIQATLGTCLNEVDANLKVLASYFGGDKFPLDPSLLGSCSSTDGSKGFFYYKYDASKGFYVVAAKIEVAASANTSSDPTAITDKTKLSENIGAGKSGVNWYASYGPK